MVSRIQRTKRIMRTIGLRAEPFQLFRLEDGTSPMVVALPNERISEVLDRVRRVGGSANVAVAYAKNFEMLTLQDSASTNAQGELLISEDISIGLLALRLRENRGKTLRLKFRDADVEVPHFESEVAYA